jgi:thiamine biosynthesis lipoprotein
LGLVTTRRFQETKMNQKNWLMRRTWLVAPLAGLARATAPATETFRKENVLGTTLELQVNGPGADAAFAACLDEVERLRKILSTYDASSELSRWHNLGERLPAPPVVAELLQHYAHWQQRTNGAVQSILNGKLDINALGKSYILEQAITAAAKAAPTAQSLLLNIGGDIAVRNGSWPVDVCNPARWHDNAPPLTSLHLKAGAIATSGGYERGATHLIDPRTGNTATGAASATVVAPDAVTANALSTALCVLNAHEGRQLVEATPGAECLAITPSGQQWRSSGFAALERPIQLQNTAASAWPKGQQVTITLTLKAIEGYRVRRPYVAVWAEDSSGKLIRNISVWSGRSRWLPDLFEWWKKSGSNDGGASVTRATRPPGRYQLIWDGRNDAGQPVPEGTYRIVVESNREHGDYAKESGLIVCGANPAKVMLKANSEFEAVELSYGPGGQQA